MGEVAFQTPKGRILVQNGTANIEFDYDLQRFAGQYSKAQRWLDNQVLTDSNKYAPFQTGVLRMSGILGTDIGSGTVEWSVPYARYLYYGKLMVGPPPKKLTEIDLKYHTPGTGAYWFETAKSVNKAQWLAGVRKIAGGG